MKYNYIQNFPQIAYISGDTDFFPAVLYKKQATSSLLVLFTFLKEIKYMAFKWHLQGEF